MSQTGSLNFGGMSTGVFGSGTSLAPAVGSSMPASGASSSPVVGASSSSFAGSSMAVQKPASGGGFGSTTQSSPSGSSFQQQSRPAFGASSTPAFGASSTSAFGSTSTPAFGASSTPAFGATSTPAFGNTGSEFGTLVFGSSTPVFGASSTPAFGASSTPAFGATCTPAFGNTGSAFGASSTPAFGASSTPAFGCPPINPFGSSPPTNPFGSSPPTNPFGSSPYGTQTPAPSFWSHGFGQPSFHGRLREGTRVTTYAPTDDYHNSASPTSKVKSISAMPAYSQKSLEELRWADYKLGDKGNALFDYPPEIWKAVNCYSDFAAAFLSTSLFGITTSGCPFGRPSSSAFGTSTSIFSTQAPGTTSSFGTGFNNGSTQSPPLLQSVTPTPGQTSFPFGQSTNSMGVDQKTNTSGFSFSPQTASGDTSSIFGQDTSRQSIHGERPILSQQSITRPSGALPATRPPLSRPFPSTQPTQNADGFDFVASSDCTSSVFGQDNSPQPQGPTLSQESITSPLGTIPATPVDVKPSPMRKSCLLNSQKRIAKKYPHKKVSFSDENLTTSTTPASQQRAGTRVTLYAQTIDEADGGELVSISAMCAYKQKSHEELRWEDYKLGDKGNIHYGFYMNNIQQPNFLVPTSTFVFGTEAQGTSSSFGNTQPFPLFQSIAPTFGQTSLPFGQTVFVIHQHFHTNLKDSA